MTQDTEKKQKTKKALNLNQLKGLRPFVKGDPRINRNGRPRGTEELIARVKELFEEEIELPNGKGKIKRIDWLLLKIIHSQKLELPLKLMNMVYGLEKIDFKGNVVFRWIKEQYAKVEEAEKEQEGKNE